MIALPGMHRAPPAVLLLALLLAGATGCSVVARGTPESPIISAFSFEGVKAVDEDDLKAKLATQSTGLLPWEDVVTYDPDLLTVDRRRVEAYYRDHGFYDAEVTDVQVIDDEEGRVQIKMKVQEGEPVKVSKITIIGLDAEPDARRAMEKLPLREGRTFQLADYDASRAEIERALRRTGWAFAEVAQEAHILPREKKAEVTYTVKAGTRYKFGTIFVAGTGAVSRDRVREQAALEVKRGAWYSDEKLVRAQARVFEMGVFGGVRVSRGNADSKRGVIPVVVAVREAPFRTVRAGPSVGVQSGTRWDLSGVAGWTHRNFYGDLRKLDLSLRAGYAWLLNDKKEGWVFLAAGEFSQPGAISRMIDATVRLELERGLEPAYDYWSERLRLSTPVRLGPRWTFVPSYNLEVYQLSNVTGTIDPNDPSAEGPDLNDCQGNKHHPVCLLSYLEERIAWDGRDNPVVPTRGFFGVVSFQQGFNLGGYGYRYLRFMPEARGYLPAWHGGVLAGRFRVGALFPVDEADPPPIVARFTAGGPQSMRGYSAGRLSPMVLDENDDWVPVGGNGMVDGSLELRFNIRGNLGAAVFTDLGYVSTPSSVPTAWRDALDATQWQWAAGFGVTYKTPVGPFRLDLAMRLPTNWSSGVPFEERFPTVPPLEPGGESQHREPILAFHLFIGEAF
ncbi:MAG: BamA/TamA family outer membrane protein [Anaeromyxobacter sp.]